MIVIAGEAAENQRLAPRSLHSDLREIVSPRERSHSALVAHPLVVSKQDPPRLVASAMPTYSGGVRISYWIRLPNLRIVITSCSSTSMIIAPYDHIKTIPAEPSEPGAYASLPPNDLHPALTHPSEDNGNRRKGYAIVSGSVGINQARYPQSYHPQCPDVAVFLHLQR